MSFRSLFLILISVLLSASSQLMMKVGMSTPAVQRALGHGSSLLTTVITIAMSPLVVLGLLCFAVSVVSWLLALSKVDVSEAYPFVALGIVITAVAGHLLLGEPLDHLRILGIVTIVAGVVIVAIS